ncbi:MAG: hypothetical protein WC890_07730 [Candidatus Margulisiibacteriota bacterium]
MHAVTLHGESQSSSSDRRIFITENGKEFYQIFSFSQNKKDGSLYVSWPEMETTKWITFKDNMKENILEVVESPGKGKISFHGSGQAHYKVNDVSNSAYFRVNGNILFDTDKNTVGARHLFTAFIKKPEYIPDKSKAFNRKHDHSFKADKIKPVIFVFFAVPQKGLNISFQLGFQCDDMESMPSDFLGCGMLPMRIHDIIWFAYRTKYLDDWPKYNHVSYSDGYKVPLFIGQADHSMRVELHSPMYSLDNNNFNINLNSQSD